MAIEFRTLFVRSARRIRVSYTAPLGMGAYATTWFTITSTNSFGADPPVQAALLIQTDPTSLELALQIDLAPGGTYDLSIAAGVPGADASTAPAVVAPFTVNTPQLDPSESVTFDDLAARIFRSDVRHDGSLMVETAAGDLATVTGPVNVKDSVMRRLLSEGLPHSSNYGAHARDSVDAPGVSLPNLSARLQAQARQDPRVISATITAAPNDNDGTFVLNGQIQLVGGTLIDLKETL